MEDFELSSSESSEASGSPEAIREKSEKQKESYKKAQAQIQKAQKDEKKAKQDNNELFNILTRFIQNPYYEKLLPRITELLTVALPSRPIIGMLALIYPDAAYHIFTSIGQADRIHVLKNLHRYDEPWEFQESQVHESIRQWMSIWIDAFDKYSIIDDASLIMQKRFYSMIENSEAIILASLSDFVWFFFSSRNIIISSSVIDSYARFILKNIRITLQKSINNNPDKDILEEQSSSDIELFGLK